MKYRVVEQFWHSFYDLSPDQKESVRRAWAIFKVDPFDRRLKTHRIQKLSADYKATVYSVVAEGNLRVIFSVDGDTATTLDVGTHSIYK